MRRLYSLIVICYLLIGVNKNLPAQVPNWEVTAESFNFFANVNAQLLIDGNINHSEDNIIGFFVNDELRGVSTANNVGNQTYHFASVYSNMSSDEQMTISVYVAEEDAVYSSNTTYDFQHQSVIGDFDKPFLIELEVNGGEPLAVDFSKADVFCATDTLGWIKANISGGMAPYDILWSNGEEKDSIFHLSEGVFDATITDAEGRQLQQSVSIKNQDIPVLAPIITAAPDTVVCKGSDVFLFAASKQDGANFKWYDVFGNTLAETSVLSLPNQQEANQYYAEVTIRNCPSPPAVANVFVKDFPEATFSVSNRKPNIKEPILFVPNAISDSLSYYWTFGDGSSSSEVSPEHFYSSTGLFECELTITTPGGCQVSSKLIVNVSDKVIDLLIDTEDSGCSNDNSGRIKVQAINGTPPYSFDWENGATGNVLEDLAAGEYNLTVTDIDGNTTSASITVSQGESPEAPQVQGAGTYCYGASISLSAFTDDTEKEIFWFASEDDRDILYHGNNINIFSLQENMTLWAEARYGNCISTSRTAVSVEIEKPAAAFTLDKYFGVIGETFVGQANIEKEDQTYTWDFGDGTTSQGFSATHAYSSQGQYEVKLTVETQSGCKAVSSSLINISDGGLQVIPVVENTSCDSDQGGQATVQIIGGQAPFSYAWSTGEQGATIKGLAQGTYSVTVTDKVGIMATAVFEVLSDSPDLDAPTLIGGGNYCVGSDITLTAFSNNAEATIYWYESEESEQPVYSGSTISLFGVQSDLILWAESRLDGCTSSSRTSVRITVEKPAAAFTLDKYFGVIGETFVGQANIEKEDHIYTWDFGDGTTSQGFSATHAYSSQGQYEVKLTVETQSGCKAVSSSLINISDGGLQVIPVVENTSCDSDQGGQATVQIIGGQAPFSYAWSTGEQGATIKGLAQGTYSVTVTDKVGIMATAVFEVLSDSPDLDAPTLIGGGSYCVGSDITLTAFSNNAEATIYWYESEESEQPVYSGSTISLFGVQSDLILWAESRLDGCTSSSRTSVRITVEKPEAAFTADNLFIVLGNEASFRPLIRQESNEYFWDFGDGTETSQNPEVSHVYKNPGVFKVELTVVTPLGCSTKSSKYINVNSGSLSIDADIEDTDCANTASGSIRLSMINGQAPYEYAWDNGQSSSFINNLSAGDYSVTVTDANGYRATATMVVAIKNETIEAPVVSINRSGIVCAGEDLQINAYTPASNARLYWYDSAENGNLVHVGNNLFIFDIQEHQSFWIEAVSGACTSARTAVNIVVNSPDAGFSMSEELTYQGRGVDFSVTNVQEGTDYIWYLGNNTVIENETSFREYFYEPGVFEVILEATMPSGCRTREQKRLNVLRYLEDEGEEIPLEVVVNTKEALCPESASGTATALVAGGSGNYTFQWSNGQRTATVENLSIGTYSLTVTDSEGAAVTTSVVIRSQYDELPRPSLSTNREIVLCQGEVKWVAAFSEIAGAQFLWYEDRNQTTPIFIGAVLPITEPGTYFVANRFEGCLSERSAVTVWPGSYSADFISFFLENGQWRFEVAKPAEEAEYTWSFGDGAGATGTSVTHSFDDQGSYLVELQVKGITGCTSSASQIIVVNENDRMRVSLNQKNVQCPTDQEGTLTAVVSGGQYPYYYLWSNGSTDSIADNLAVGNYELTITDAANNTMVVQGQISSQITGLDDISVTVIDSNLCRGSEVQILAQSSTGNMEFYWYDQPSRGTAKYAGDMLQIFNVQEDQQWYVEARTASCQSAVRTLVTVDIDESCDTIIAQETASIAGGITTTRGVNLPEVSVELNGWSGTTKALTQPDGQFLFDFLRAGYDYSVRPSYNADYTTGVSTLDLIRLSKHIIGVEVLTSPYELIAADVNNSGSISTLDLIQLRKLVLSIDEKFPASSSWKFVERSYQFSNPEEAMEGVYPQLININNLEDEVTGIDFYAIKIGDVNQSVSDIDLDRSHLEELSISLASQQSPDGMLLTLKADQLEHIAGFQFTISFDPEQLELQDIQNAILKNEHLGLSHLQDGFITVSWFAGPDDQKLQTDILMSLSMKKLSKMSSSDHLPIDVNSRWTKAEAYHKSDYRLMNVRLTTTNWDVQNAIRFWPIQNPVNTHLALRFELPRVMNMQFTVNDLNGKVVENITIAGTKGFNELIINTTDFPSGILFLTVRAGGYQKTQKLIKF